MAKKYTEGQWLTHYTISRTSDKDDQRALTLNMAMLNKLALLIRQFEHPNRPYEIRQGKGDVYHIVFIEKTNDTVTA